MTKQLAGLVLAKHPGPSIPCGPSGGFQSMGVAPKSSKLDHDLVLKQPNGDLVYPHDLGNLRFDVEICIPPQLTCFGPGWRSPAQVEPSNFGGSPLGCTAKKI